MTHEYLVRRYTAYFRGWCQAFGDHEGVTDETSGIRWLFTVNRIGFILPARMTHSLHREVLGRVEAPLLILGGDSARVGAISFPMLRAPQRHVPATIRGILESGADVSLFLTSHFMYGTATRIITLSPDRPLSIIYREIDAMRVRLQADFGAGGQE